MKNYYEELFELRIKYASKEILDEMVKEYPTPEELHGKYSYSSTHVNWAQDIIKNEKQKVQSAKDKKKLKIHRVGVRVATVFCIVMATATCVAFTVPPIRMALSNFLLEEKETYYDLELQEKNENRQFDIPAYIEEYIPKGFEVTDVFESQSMLIVTFENDANDMIRLERLVGTAGITLDAEDSNYEDIMIGKNKGHSITKNGETVIVFNSDEYGYILSSTLTRSELIKIARKILR